MAGTTWLKFYPSDWQSDNALRLCSIAARGLWIEMLCIMHQAGGYLLISGNPVSDLALSRLISEDLEITQKLVEELEQNGVFSRNKNGVPYSRRILSDIKRAKTNSQNGKMGAALSGWQERQKIESPKPTPEPPLGPHARESQKPEARKQQQQASVILPGAAEKLGENQKTSTLPEKAPENPKMEPTTTQPETCHQKTTSMQQMASAAPLDPATLLIKAANRGMAAAGHQRFPAQVDLGKAREWLAAGADEGLVEDVAFKVTSAMIARGAAPPRMLKLLDPDIAAAIKARPYRDKWSDLPEHLAKWHRRLDLAEQGAVEWPKDRWGGFPGERDCEIPPPVMDRAMQVLGRVKA
jgi:hypothetical protein